MGRWISCDPAGGLNLYLYVNCNPVNYIDPDGAMMHFNSKSRGAPQNQPPTPTPLQILQLSIQRMPSEVSSQIRTKPFPNEYWVANRAYPGYNYEWSHSLPLKYWGFFNDLDLDVNSSQYGKELPMAIHEALGQAGWDEAWDQFIENTNWEEIVSASGISAAKQRVLDFLGRQEQEFGIAGKYNAFVNYSPDIANQRIGSYDYNSSYQQRHRNARARIERGLNNFFDRMNAINEEIERESEMRERHGAEMD